MEDRRPYATLLAKGEDRRRRILEVAQRLLARNGWRSTTLGQIARDAGVTAAGILHHFSSKEQLLHAVLDARDEYDLARADLSADTVDHVAEIAERFHQVPELVGTYVVLLVENLDPQAPLHDRLLSRHRAGVRVLADTIRRGQLAGRYRTDVDPAVKAVEIVAFLNGMETSWLLDPSVPVDEVFAEYARSLRAALAPPAGGS